MPTLDEIANTNTEQTETTNIPMDKDVLSDFQPTEQPSRMNDLLNKLLTAETGEGPIEDYLDHPMNFLKSKGLAQILRGVHGLGANLKLAIIDIGFGFVRFTNERKVKTNDNGVDVSSGGGFPS